MNNVIRKLYKKSMLKRYWQEIALFFAIAFVGIAFALKAYLAGFGVLNDNLDLNFNSALGSFLSGTIGLAVSTYAVVLIKRTYNLQKQELDETRRLLKSQLQDQTFFNLISSLDFILENMKHVDVHHFFSVGKGSVIDRKEYGNYEFLKFFQTLFYEFFKDMKKLQAGETISQNMQSQYHRILNLNTTAQNSVANALKDYSIEKCLIYTYTICYEALENVLSSYFLTVYQILKHIESLDITARDRYISIFQARLNSIEKTLIFYNGLCFPKAKKRINELWLLKNLSVEDLITPEHALLYREVKYSRGTHLKELLGS